MFKSLLVFAGLAVALLVGCGDKSESVAISVRVPPATKPTASWVTDQDVYAIAVAGDTVYAAGYIKYVGPDTGSLALFPSGSRHPQPGWPPILGGRVQAVVSDGSGGRIVGGSFETVGGRACPHLAHLTSERALDPRFCLTPSAAVEALASDGHTVFVGGEFHRIGGRPRLRLAALELGSGRVLPWTADVTGRPFEARGGNDSAAPSVMSLALDGGTLFVGGFFERIGGVQRVNLAALDAETGQALPWRADAAPEELSYGDVRVLAIGEESLYVAGSFSELGGVPAPGVGAVNERSGERVRWSPWRRDEPRVTALAHADGVVYLATGSRIVAVDSETGAAKKGFHPQRITGYEGVGALAVVGTRLYAGGDFSRVGTFDRSNLAAFDRRSGQILPWSLRTNAPVRVLAAAEGAIAAGGDFTSAGGVRRNGLVAIDGKTGRLLPWTPRFDSTPTALAATESRLYVGGGFERVNGKKRDGLAAFDLATRQLTAWAPALTPEYHEVRVLAVDQEDTVYVGGSFHTVNGESRVALAALDAGSGLLRPWSAELGANGNDGSPTEVDALAVTTERVFIAGNFVRVGDVARDGLAELDGDSGDVDPWSPRIAGGLIPSYYELTALLRSDDILYVGGHFSSFDGTPRQNLAAVDARTHDLLPWDPGSGASWVETQVNHIAEAGQWLVVVGDFGIAIINPTTGRVLPWRPSPAETPHTADTVAVGPTVFAFDGYVGGNADSISVYRFIVPDQATRSTSRTACSTTRTARCWTF